MTDFKQFSEELRLAGKAHGLDWLVGAFFANELLTNTQTLWAGNDFDLYLGGLSSASVGPPNFLLVPGLIYLMRVPTGVVRRSGFAMNLLG